MSGAQFVESSLCRFFLISAVGKDNKLLLWSTTACKNFMVSFRVAKPCLVLHLLEPVESERCEPLSAEPLFLPLCSKSNHIPAYYVYQHDKDSTDDCPFGLSVLFVQWIVRRSVST